MAQLALILGHEDGKAGGRDEANGGSMTSVRQNCDMEVGGENGRGEGVDPGVEVPEVGFEPENKS